jgi:hypothetical protein
VFRGVALSRGSESPEVLARGFATYIDAEPDDSHLSELDHGVLDWGIS